MPSILSNPPSMIAANNLTRSSNAVSSSISRLSSGNRIVQAKDDAAALAIGSSLRAEVAGLKQAKINAGQAQAMLQIADGAFSTINDVLVRAKTLAVQANSGQQDATARAALNTEYGKLLAEIDRIAGDTEFNGNTLIDGSRTITNAGNALSGAATSFDGSTGIDNIEIAGESFTGTNTYMVAYLASSGDVAREFTVTLDSGDADAGEATVFKGSISSATYTGPVELHSVDGDNNERMYITINSSFAPGSDLAGTTTQTSFDVSGSTLTTYNFQIGTGTSGDDAVGVDISSGNSAALGLSGTSVDTTTNAAAAITAVDSAIDTLSSARAALGANQSRFDFATANLDSAIVNTESARSALLDVDVSDEISNLTSKQILVQSGISMLTQAQTVQQGLVQLLQV